MSTHPALRTNDRPSHGLARCTGDRHLCRFRADPLKVQVSIRRYPWGDGWVVTMRARFVPPNTISPLIQVTHHPPSRALVIALRQAEQRNLPGIDVGMERAYEHPQGSPR